MRERSLGQYTIDFHRILADSLIQIFLIPTKQYHRMFKFLNFTKKKKT